MNMWDSLPASLSQVQSFLSVVINYVNLLTSKCYNLSFGNVIWNTDLGSYLFYLRTPMLG